MVGPCEVPLASILKLVTEQTASWITAPKAARPRFTVLEAGGRVIVIYELAMLEVVDTLWPRAEDVIASIEWSAE